MATWRINDKSQPHLELVPTAASPAPLNAHAESPYCVRNAVIGSTFVARSAGT